MKTWKLEAELQAITSVLQSPSDIKNLLISRLTEEHFAYDQMLLSYKVLSKLLKVTTNLPSIETFLQAPGLTAEAIDVIRTSSEPIISNVDDANHLLTVLDYYRKSRKSLELAMTITAKMKANDALPDMTDITSDIEKTLSSLNLGTSELKITNLGKGQDGDTLLKDLLDGELPRLVPSTFLNFDIKVGGFGCNELVILASHAKGGKSLIALNMLIRMYLQHNQNVIMVSMEMSREEVRDRLVANLTGVDYNKIRTKTMNKFERDRISLEWAKFNEHGEKNGCRFTIWDTAPGLTTSQLKLQVKNRGYNVVCVDYLNLMEAAEAKLPDWQRLSVLGRELKQATKELDTLILSPTQMNDDGDVRYSKALKEHANTMWRWFYKEEQKASHLIRVDQLVVRSWEQFPFMLREDFGRSIVMDGPSEVIEQNNSAGGKDEDGKGKSKRKEELNRMYKDD